MACFRMTPLYAMPTHRVINIFLPAYISEWLDYEESLGVKLIEDVTSGELVHQIILVKRSRLDKDGSKCLTLENPVISTPTSGTRANGKNLFI